MQKKDSYKWRLLPRSVFKAHLTDYLRRKAENPNAKRIRAQYIYTGPNVDTGKIETIRYTIQKRSARANDYEAVLSSVRADKTSKRRGRTPTLKDYTDALGPAAGRIAFDAEQVARQDLYKGRKNYQQIDHVIPLGKGGYTISTIMVPLEAQENLWKSDFLPTGLQGEIYEMTGFVQDDVVATIRKIDEKTRDGTLATPEKMLEISRALAIASQHQADFNFTNGLPAFLDQVKEFTRRTATKAARNVVPGVGTAMAAQDTVDSAQEFMEEPTPINFAQTALDGVSTVANAVGDAAMVTGIGAPVAAVAEKVSVGATAVRELSQLVEDNMGQNEEEDIEVPSGLSPRQRARARSMARRAAN